MAAPETEKTKQASKVETPGSDAPAQKPAAAAAATRPGRRVASLFTRALFSVVLLLVVLGVAGYGALIFRESDPNVRVAADYVDQGLKEARGLYAKMEALVAGATGETPPPEAARGAHALLEKTPLDSPAPEAATAATDATPAKTPEPPAPSSTEAAPAPSATTEAKPVDDKPVDLKSADVRPAESKSLDSPPIEGKVIEAAPAAVPAPLPAATPAPAATAIAKGVDADGFSDRDLISALEGRIDALGDEVKALRDRLDAPKNETRAAPEAEAPKPAPAPAPVADVSGPAVVLAFALQRDLEAGRPFADEIAAFSRLAVEPAPAPVLIEIAEKGAPTGAQLRDMFAPLAKKLEAQESHGAADSGALADHILQGASKLVKVRPTGESEPESLAGKLRRIEAALTHNDFVAAERLYDSLPEAARAETGDFGAALRQRLEAARAADDLLHGAIAALGKK